MILLFTLALSHAAASPWSTFCQRILDAVVMDDPHQYMTAPDDWLDRETERLFIRQRWGRLTPSDHSHLQILLAERRRRDAIQSILNQPKDPNETLIGH